MALRGGYITANPSPPRPLMLVLVASSQSQRQLVIAVAESICSQPSVSRHLSAGICQLHSPPHSKSKKLRSIFYRVLYKHNFTITITNSNSNSTHELQIVVRCQFTPILPSHQFTSLLLFSTLDGVHLSTNGRNPPPWTQSPLPVLCSGWCFFIFIFIFPTLSAFCTVECSAVTLLYSTLLRTHSTLLYSLYSALRVLHSDSSLFPCLLFMFSSPNTLLYSR